MTRVHSGVDPVRRQSFGSFGLLVFAALLTGCATTGPNIISGYGSMQAAARARSGAHPAIDYGGNGGASILAAADGTVSYAAYSSLCGNGVRVWHVDFNRFTLYCHMSELRVALGDTVKRGQVIGLLGASGEPTLRTPPGGFPIPQLHFELAEDSRPRNDGDLAGSYDPLSITIGCFSSEKSYPKDRLVLTHPVTCRDAEPR